LAPKFTNIERDNQYVTYRSAQTMPLYIHRELLLFFSLLIVIPSCYCRIYERKFMRVGSDVMLRSRDIPLLWRPERTFQFLRIHPMYQ